jgi:ribosomal protein L14
VGDIIVAAVKSPHPAALLKMVMSFKAVIVRTKKGMGRNDGSYIRFDWQCGSNHLKMTKAHVARASLDL